MPVALVRGPDFVGSAKHKRFPDCYGLSELECWPVRLPAIGATDGDHGTMKKISGLARLGRFTEQLTLPKKTQRYRVVAIAAAVSLAACSGSSPVASPAPTTSAPATSAPSTAGVPTTDAAPSTTVAAGQAPDTTIAAQPTAPTAATFAVRPAVVDTCPTTDGGLTCWKVTVPVDYTKPNGKTIDIAVAGSRADPTKWTSPILRAGGAFTFVDWTGTVAAPIPGHDWIIIDHRGTGRSAPLGLCPGLERDGAAISTGPIEATLAGLINTCVQAAVGGELPLASVIDNNVAARDASAVRQALGIDRWGISNSSDALDVGLRLVALEPDHVTGLLSNVPAVAGEGPTAAKSAEAFAAFAADCAAVASCASIGDMNNVLTKDLERLRPDGNITTTANPGVAGKFIVLTESGLARGIEVAIGTPSLAGAVPGLLAGGLDGGSDNLIAGYFISQTAAPSAYNIAANCQQVGLLQHPMSEWSSASAGPFGAISFKALCDAAGPVPQLPVAPPVSANIPVLVFLPAYATSSSRESATRIFKGFPSTTTVFAPGLSDASQVPCFNTVRASFFDDPTKPVDTTCISDAPKRTFG